MNTYIAIFLLQCGLLYFSVNSAEIDTKKEIRIGVVFTNDDEISFAALRSAVSSFKKFYRVDLKKYVLSENHDSFELSLIACRMIEDGIIAIIGPEIQETSDTISAIANLVQIPHFQVFPDFHTTIPATEPDATVGVFNVYPDLLTTSKAIATLIKESRWKSFIVLYEDDYGIARMQEVFKGRKMGNLPILMRKLKPVKDHRPLLKEVKNLRQYNILLDCNTENVLTILNQAKEVNLTEEYQSFILTSLDAHTLDFGELRSTLSNITTLKMVVNNTQARSAVKDWNSQVFADNRFYPLTSSNIPLRAALVYDAINMLVSNFYRMEARDGEDIQMGNLSCVDPEAKFEFGPNISRTLTGSFFSAGILPGPLTGPVKFDETGRRTQFELQFLQLTPYGFIETGLWNSESPHVINLTKATQIEVERVIKTQIHEKTFRVYSKIGEPYFMEKETPPGSTIQLTKNDRYEGYVVDLIREIADFLNFSYIIEKVPDNEYGVYNPDTKEWNGLIRHILDRKADLALCDLTITYDRRKAVDFSTPFMNLGISILYTKAVKEPPELFSFLQPLSLDVWLFMATSYLIITLIILLIARLSQKDWENPHPCNDNPEELENTWSIRNCFWLTMGSLMQQGCDILPKGIYTRMATSMWWFFTLIMLSCYTANLTAFLTMERMGPTIESAEDLAKQTKIKYGCVGDGSTALFFKHSNFNLYHRMWMQMKNAEPSVFERTNEAGVQRVLRSKSMYAFIMESSSIEYQIERHCSLRQVGQKMDSKGYGIAMPFNSPYRTQFNQAILKMQENGVLHNLKEKWWKKERGGGACTKQKETDDGSASELGILHVGGVFVVLVGGVVLAFLIAVGEFLWGVHKLSVKTKVSTKEALKTELEFVTNLRVKRKATNLQRSE